MKIQYIKVRGAIGFKKGMGVDEIEFDFRDKSGLVALSGKNGRGKTTLLELMSPYRTFASRKGKLNHHFFLRDSFIETKFLYNGDEYHTIRKIDSESDRAEAFIVVNSESKVNGKVTEYDKYIVELFGSQTLFYNSVFCAQGSGNLSDMTTGKIKELFVEFLRIERLAAYEGESKKGVTYCQKKLDVLSGEIQACNDQIVSHETTESDLREIRLNISTKNVLLVDFNSDIKSIESSIKDLEAKKLKNQENISKKAELETELSDLKNKKYNLDIKIKKFAGEFEEKRKQFVKELSEFDSFLSQKDDILSASSKLEHIKQMGKHFSECFDCAVSEHGNVNDKKTDLDQNKISIIQGNIKKIDSDPNIIEIKNRIDKYKKSITQKDGALQALIRSKKEIENDINILRLEDQIKNLNSEVALSVDPDCHSSICPALKRIEDAKDKIPILNEQFKLLKQENQSQLNIISADIKETEAKLIIEKELLKNEEQVLSDSEKLNQAAISAFKEELKAYKTEFNKLFNQSIELIGIKGFYKQKLDDTKKEYQLFSAMAAKKSELDIIESKREALQKQLDINRDNYESRAVELSDDLNQLSKSVTNADDKIKEITCSIVENIDDEIKTLSVTRQSMSRQSDEINESLVKLQNRVAVLENDLLKNDELKKSLEHKKDIESTIKKELSEWEYLKLACSKTGLQALEIDGAAPLITTEANALLEKAFGLDSQIRIVTQDPESGREVFWIKVIREDGAEDDFGNLSGGQKVWIAKALSLGMTLVSKRKSGRNFRTLFADEEDGSLDNEKALEFIQLYRSMMITGDFDTCFYISHNPDVVAMADHEVKF